MKTSFAIMLYIIQDVKNLFRKIKNGKYNYFNIKKNCDLKCLLYKRQH